MNHSLELLIEAVLWFFQFWLTCEMIRKLCDRKDRMRPLFVRLLLAGGLTLAELILLKLISGGIRTFYFGSMFLFFIMFSLVLRASYLMTASISILLIMMRTAMIPLGEVIVIRLYHLQTTRLSGAPYLVSEVIGTVIMGIAVFIVTGLCKRTTYELPRRVQLIILLNIIVFASIIIFHYDTMDIAVQSYRFFILIFLLICSYLVFINYSSISYAKQMESQMKVQYMQYEKQFERELLGSYDKLRKLRHDFKNHIFYMSSLLQSNHYQELKDYFDTLSDTVYQNTSQASTGNHLCNLVLEQKRLIALQEGIKFTLNCQIPPVLNMSDMDLVSFLSNVLDNAIEASAYVEDPQITVVISRKNADMFFRISNRYDENSSGIKKGRRTSKSDTLNHGFGLDILKDIAQRYDGSIRFVQDKDLFTVLCYMKI